MRPESRISGASAALYSPYSRNDLTLPFICSAYLSTSSLERISLTAASACLTAAVATLKTLPHQPPDDAGCDVDAAAPEPVSRAVSSFVCAEWGS